MIRESLNLSHCPHCDGENLEGGPLTAEDNGAWQEMFCADCESEWVDCYEIACRAFTRKAVTP